MIKSILSLGLGTALVKSIPIIFSYIIAERYGGEVYTQFISLLLSANVIINISVLGVVPQIISRNSQIIDFNQMVIPIVVALLLCFLIWFLDSIYNSVILLIYVISMVILYLTTAFYNSILHNTKSAVIWMACGVLGIIMSLASYFYDIEKSIVLLFFISSFTIVALLSLAKVKWEGFSFKCLYISDLKITLINSIFISLFGFSVIFSFYYAQDSLKDGDKLVFSIFYQFFTLATFIPTVIGNIVIPRLVRGDLSIKAKLLFPIVYALIFLMISTLSLLAFYMLLPLNSPELELLISSRYEVLILWLSTLLAVLSTYRFQVFMSYREFKDLFKLSFIWGGVFFSVSSLMGNSLLSFSFSLLSCYLFYTLTLVFFERKRNGKIDLAS
ncbi:MAG: hypothetical protein ACERKF_15400 [Vibrio cyclitrophicus]